jgi:branched-chain amino acid transport system substrate-binding protein
MKLNYFLPLIIVALDFACPHLSVADQTVRIGQVSPLTGEQAAIGKDSENGVRLAIEDLNKKRIRIGGQNVTFVLESEDDAGDPRLAVTVAQKLVDDHVAGVIGHANSGTTIPASKVYFAAGIPMITPSATNPKITEQGYNNTFRVLADDVQQGRVIGRYLVGALNLKKVAIVDDRTAYGEGLADQIEKSVTAAGGTVVTRQYGTNNTTNWMSVLTAIKAVRPDAIAFTGIDQPAATFVQQMKRLAMNVTFIAGDASCAPELITLAGAAMTDKAYCTLTGLPSANMPQGAGFFNRFQQRFGTPVQIYAPYAYDATMVLASAMQAAGSIDPKVFLPKVKDVKYDGVTAHIEFDTAGQIKNGSITVRKFDHGQWIDKAIEH